MISALCWVPKGAAAAVPQFAEPTDEEIAAAEREAAARQEAAESKAGEDNADGDGSSDEWEEVDGDEPAADSSDDEMEAEEDVARARAAALKALQMSKEGRAGDAGQAETADLEVAMSRLGGGGMEELGEGEEEEHTISRIYNSAVDEEYVGEDEYMQKVEEDDDSEIEDFTLRGSDLVMVAAKHDEDVSSLEVWVFEEADARGGGNLYVHHDILLPEMPLAVAWMDLHPARPDHHGNLVAVGTFDPGIEIWDLDVLDALEPAAVLGGESADAGPPEPPAEVEDGSQTKKKKKKKKKKTKKPERALQVGSHTDSVLGLAWNAQFRNLLASASADRCVKLWDVTTSTCQHTLTHHADKVQALAWNPAEPPVLLTGAFDRQAAVVDMRQPDSPAAFWRVGGDVEALAWNLHSPTQFLVAAEDGVVAAFDARKGAGTAPLFRLHAHDKPTTALVLCPALDGLLATASTDKKVKLWSISGGKPEALASENLQVGAVFTLGFCGDSPTLLAAAGAGGAVTVWDVKSCVAVQERYQVGKAAEQEEDDT